MFLSDVLVRINLPAQLEVLENHPYQFGYVPKEESTATLAEIIKPAESERTDLSLRQSMR